MFSVHTSLPLSGTGRNYGDQARAGHRSRGNHQFLTHRFYQGQYLVSRRELIPTYSCFKYADWQTLNMWMQLER